MKRRCFVCGAENRQDAVFCLRCGAALDRSENSATGESAAKRAPVACRPGGFGAGSPAPQGSQEWHRQASLPTAGYAGFWRRAVALLVDLVALSTLYRLIFSGVEEEAEFAGLIGYWLYYALCEASPLQATPGKLLIGLVVTDLAGRRLSFGRASGRFWAKFLSAFMLGLGFVMAGITPRKQALHDWLSGCLVMIRRY